jgi:bifunctional non-homologous end joining protein LigD
MTPRNKATSDPAVQVDRQLARYREMRDFGVTAEPRGGEKGGAPKPAESLPFVVQKHAARQLHYDFRLGWNGVLKSWAVAKGPSYFPGDKRLAVEVEDHPMEYGGFEGTIPKGQYGGGTVMIWDYGEWKGLGNVDRELETGNLKLELNGTKLKGKWALVRMKNNRGRSDKPNWLLIKEKDGWAQPEDAPSITEEAPNSAVTQRTMEQIAECADHVWDSRQGLLISNPGRETQSPASAAKSATGQRKKLERLLRKASREPTPGFIPPQLAQQGRKAPSGTDWIHELKLDGYRIQIRVLSGKNGASDTPTVALFTRTGLDWTHRMQGLAQATAGLKVESCILDGEYVALDHEGRSNFSDLQAAFQGGKRENLVYFAFDLLHLNGHNVRQLPLLERKAILAELLSQAELGSALRASDHIEGRGPEVFAKACELGAEGVVSKLASAPYSSGRGNAWIKMKCALQQEFVIGGFTPPERGVRGIGALLLGYYEGKKLRYAGRVGTGFSDQTQHELRDRLDPLAQKTTPFEKLPADARGKVSWVKPKLVAQVSFSTWTHDNLIRQSSFRGLREDKIPQEVIREGPATEDDCPDCPSPDPSPASDANLKTARYDLNGVRLTHPGKVIDAQSGLTKLQVAEYYLAVAEHLLPHIADRPLSVVRCPDGVGKSCFFQKHVSSGLPAGVGKTSIPNRKTRKVEEFLTVNTVEGLLGLAQLGALEIHPWGSKNESFEQADRIIFDLDPDENVPWNTLASAAEDLRSRLKQLGLTSFLKSTGGKGLHVVVPIQPKYEWPIIKQFSHAVVLQMEKSNPALYLTKMAKAARINRIYLDYLRNDREATAIAPFSTRARPGVPVAVPLEWKELKSSVRPAFSVLNFATWKSRLQRDPWRNLDASEQNLEAKTLRAVGVNVD